MKNDKLNPRHKAFWLIEYLANGMNAKQAYLSVYKNVKKRFYSKKLMVAGWLTMQRLRLISMKLKEIKQAKKASIDRDWIVNEYMQIIRKFQDGRPRWSWKS